MAAFEGFQGSNESRFSPTVYGYSFSNSESVVDKSNIQFSMWKTTIKISISPLIDTGTNEWRVDRKNAISAYLIPAKAMMFANILKRYKEDPEKYNNWGVASGSAYISVTYAATELDLIAIQLMQYAKAMSNAVAFTVTHNQYDYLDKIAQKVGADFSGGYAKTYTNQSYFSQAGAQQQQTQPPMSAGLESLIGQ